jgi:hypothetical protein
MKNMTIDEFIRKLIQYEGIAVEKFYVDENRYDEEVFVAKVELDDREHLPNLWAKRRETRLQRRAAEAVAGYRFWQNAILH